jgi:hypothetical protein
MIFAVELTEKRSGQEFLGNSPKLQIARTGRDMCLVVSNVNETHFL